ERRRRVLPRTDLPWQPRKFYGAGETSYLPALGWRRLPPGSVEAPGLRPSVPVHRASARGATGEQVHTSGLPGPELAASDLSLAPLHFCCARITRAGQP